MYGISSFCTLSENNSFLHGKISCFCIFLAENGVLNTNRSPRVADGIRNELCFRIFPLTTLGSMFQIEEKCHIQNNAHCSIRGEDACQQIPPEHLRIRSGIGVFHLPTEFIQDFIQSIGCLTLKHPSNLFVGLFLYFFTSFLIGLLLQQCIVTV